MRKIKFRAWITDSWDEEDNPVYEMCYDLAFEEYAPINDLLGGIDTLMQFTGLYDKNGKEIWEGDILKADDGNYRDWETDRKSTRLNSSHRSLSRMPSSA